MAQIFIKFEKSGFELLDDSIYHNDVNLIEVGCTEETWWMVRRAEGNQHVPSNSALDAVQFLSTINTLPMTEVYLQYRLLEHLTSRE